MHVEPNDGLPCAQPENPAYVFPLVHISAARPLAYVKEAPMLSVAGQELFIPTNIALPVRSQKTMVNPNPL